MEENAVETKKKKRFFPKVRGFRRFLLFTGIWFVVLIVFLAASAEYTSRPSFCPTCHYMEPFYQSWKTSSHNKVECVQCHFEPGLEGKIKGKLNGLVQIVNYISSSYKKRKPWADIPDNTCGRAGCHENQAFKDTVYVTKGINFNHKHHLQELRRGKKLKCTSCHSQIVQGSHMQVTYTTCFNCHFKKSDDPEHKLDKLSNCKTCHTLDQKTPEQLAAMRFNHTSVVERKIECNSCHSNVVAGNGEVGKERCFQCHFETEKLDKYPDVEFMHKTHILKHSMTCIYCHSPIEHKVQKLQAGTAPDCKSCHENSHSPQVDLYTGVNGKNTEESPSSMYASGISCKGCHTLHEAGKSSTNTMKAKKDACDNCHGKGYGNLIGQWEQSTSKRLVQIKSIFNSAKRIIEGSKSDKKNEALVKLDEAQHNIKIVELGKSVHNIQFADKLLVGSYGLMKDAVGMVSGSKLPDFKSNADYVPNECSNCHSGIQEVNKTIFGKQFSHNVHIVKQHVQCNKCHSNDKKHGELIISFNTCNSCHHSEAKTNDACAKCHGLTAQVYNGTFEGKNSPDIMKSNGVGCVDCHNDKGQIVKPNEKICAKCHDAEYSKMMLDWKSDIKKLSGTLNEILSKNSAELNGDANAVNDAKTLIKKINANPSLFAHNYDLLSTLLSEKKKKLGK
ncbi:MAG: cytochrome c3 family protein [Bacteroidetes bacterium]|nr:cytochrome c3 family protein [Bacteroidota bacterium]